MEIRHFSKPVELVARIVFPILEGFRLAHELGGRLRGLNRFKSRGTNVRFSALDSRISFDQIEIGNDVFVGSRAYFSGPCEIGNDVMFGPEVHLMAGYHRTDLIGSTIQESGPGQRATIVIEDDVWVGARVTVLKGIRIGEGAVVGNGSIVTTDVPPYTIVAGAPSQVRKLRFSDQDLRKHLAARGRTRSAIEEVIARRKAN